jgi:hypothetical protein
MATRKKFYWRARTSSGGTLSLDLSYEGPSSKQQTERLLAEAIQQAHEHMEREGFIPLKAQLMTARDIAKEHGSTRQYWEKLLNEGKILYRETSAGRITTDLWVNGYLKRRDEVNRYVRNVNRIIKQVQESCNRTGELPCPVCFRNFEYSMNYEYINGICRSCGFYVHSTAGEDVP